MAKDIMVMPVSTISSESCFSLIGRIIEERRRRLAPKTVEMLACLKDGELGEKREQHEAADDKDLKDAFKNLFLDDEGEGKPRHRLMQLLPSSLKTYVDDVFLFLQEMEKLMQLLLVAVAELHQSKMLMFFCVS
jgi:hypothetical protein